MGPKKSLTAVWAGIIAPMLYVPIFVIAGLLRLGYDSRTMYISALALGPHGWVQILNSALFGLLLLVFARGISAATLSRTGHALLTIIGFGFIILGFFVTDPAAGQRTIHGSIHQIIARIVLFLAPVSCFAFLPRFRQQKKWRRLVWTTRAAGTMVAIAVATLAIATMTVAGRSAFTPWVGLLQRAVVVPWMAWVLIFALSLRHTGTDP